MGKSRGDELVAQGEKKAAGSSGWFSSSSTKFEEAADFFQQAGNAYKIDQQWRESGSAFEKEAQCRLKADEKNDAMNAFHNASKSYKKVDPGAAINALQQTIKLVLDAGNFRQAADREKDIAQIHYDMGQLPDARDSYMRAGGWYENEDARATANQCFLKAAELSAEMGDNPKAIELYRKVADISLQSPMTKYSVKEYWLRAALCALAMGDLVTVGRILDEGVQKDLPFQQTREYKFAHELMDACEEQDIERYTAAIFQYDQVTKLDNWKTKVLLDVKKALEGEEDGLT